MALIEGKPHKPTFVGVLIAVVILFILYHILFGRKRG